MATTKQQCPDIKKKRQHEQQCRRHCHRNNIRVPLRQQQEQQQCKNIPCWSRGNVRQRRQPPPQGCCSNLHHKVAVATTTTRLPQQPPPRGCGNYHHKATAVTSTRLLRQPPPQGCRGNLHHQAAVATTTRLPRQLPPRLPRQPPPPPGCRSNHHHQAAVATSTQAAAATSTQGCRGSNHHHRAAVAATTTAAAATTTTGLPRRQPPPQGCRGNLPTGLPRQPLHKAAAATFTQGCLIIKKKLTQVKIPILGEKEERGTEGHSNGEYLWWKIKKRNKINWVIAKSCIPKKISFEGNNIYTKKRKLSNKPLKQSKINDNPPQKQTKYMLELMNKMITSENSYLVDTSTRNRTTTTTHNKTATKPSALPCFFFFKTVLHSDITECM